jgi:hypothetical protein
MSLSTLNCQVRLFSDFAVGTGLAFLVFPGFLLNLYPVDSKLLQQKEGSTVQLPEWRRYFFTGICNWQSVLIHLVVYMVLFFLYLFLMSFYFDNCFK